MVEIKSKDGEVEIIQLEGSEERIVADVGVIAHKVLLTSANTGSKSTEEVYIRYGILARQLVDYIDKTVFRVDELGS